MANKIKASLDKRLKEEKRSGNHRTTKDASHTSPKKAAMADIPPLNPQMQDIADWLETVRFKKAVIGGVEEADVWRKIDELYKMYNVALAAERARYDALLAQARLDTKGKNGGGA